MRTFAQKPQAQTEPVSAAHTSSKPTSHEAQARPAAGNTAPPRSPGMAHDFSRIPLFHQACATAAPPTAEHEHELAEPSLATAHSLSFRLPDATGIPRNLRAKMEYALDADFSDVRLHANSTRASHLQAEAFTEGRDIHMAPGYWAPDTSKGQQLLGHELGHVLQQRSGRVSATSQLGGSGLNNDPALEREADAFGRRAINTSGDHAESFVGASTAPLTASGVIQRQGLPASAAVEQVMQALAVVSPVAGVGDYTAAFRILDGLSVNELMTTLAELSSRLQLESLITNAGAARAFNQTRLVTAMQVVRQMPNLSTAQATITASGLPAADQLTMNNFVTASRPAGADQRAIAPGPVAALPDAPTAQQIGYELEPNSRPAPAPPAAPAAPAAPAGGAAPPAPAAAAPPAPVVWDGKAGAPNEAAARATLQSQLFHAFDAYITAFRPQTVAALSQQHVSFNTPAPAPGAAAGAPAGTGVVDIANQARAVLETRYGTSMDAATSSPAQVSKRSARVTTPGPGQNLFDASSEADRSTLVGDANLAHGVPYWLFEHDLPGGTAGAAGSRHFATDILASHHYTPQDDPGNTFRWAVSNAYTAAQTIGHPNNQRMLIDYRMTGWSEEGQRGITLQSGFTPGANPSTSELQQRWQVFKSATHESLHLRTHPAFTDAIQGRGSMQEGFTEMFTVSTLNTDVLPRVRSGSVEPLRRTVEGAQSTPAPDATLITDRVSPSQYAEPRAEAERIRDGGTPPGGPAHSGVGESAVRAAFFEGHVEYLGLAPAGTPLATLPAAGAPVQTRIRPGMAGLDDLASRSGVPRATIERDNAGITDALPATAVLTGCREHWVVAGETRANIAAQNGVTEVALVRANPDIPTDASYAWPTLSAGQKILVPAH
ncbi:eCIS core domain-containing protein [Dyella tabacisoli]|nr:DUF4157 domain-containing protein [Dyella tabacisoli]